MRSHDSADTSLFKKGRRMGEISLFLFFKINHHKKDTEGGKYLQVPGGTTISI